MSASKPARAPIAQKEEARRFERHATSFQVNVAVFLNGERLTFRGEGCDISRGGLRLFVPRELDPGTSLTLDFHIPYQAIQFSMNGVVRNRNGFTHGIEFINATPDQRQMIDRTCKVFDLLR